ncbi:Multiple rna-binding domain-containing protein, partial [Thalictrum thalictroides]
SRICVKNLPKYVGEDRIREFFSQKGEVTDVKLIRNTEDGKSRQFGFVGFRTEGEAESAIKYFNNSYLDTSRINCELARRIGDPNTPRPWSKYSAKKQEAAIGEKKESASGKSLSLSESKGELKKSKKSVDGSDPKLEEFLQVMKPRTRSKLWANDTVGNHMDENGESSLKETESQTSKKQSVLKQDISDEKESEFIETHSAKKPHNPARDEVISDVDYFKSRVKKQWSDSDSDSDPENDKDAPSETWVNENVHEVVVEDVHDEHKEDPSQAIDEEEEPIEKDEREQVLETGRLFVRNLPYTATEDDLTELFQTFDHLSQVHLVLDKDTKRSKGYAYILYAFPESAVRALEELDKSIFQGRLLHIMPAQPQKSLENQEVVAASQTAKSLKQQREERRKASEASGDTRAWNSLFMRSDTVVENIARKYGVSKSELLDREADDLAVRIALGETQVIADTKKALVSYGVNVSALEGFVSGKTEAVKRSNHIVLVKHLPYGSSEGDLAKMFGKFGSIDKIILPPTKTLALVCFLSSELLCLIFLFLVLDSGLLLFFSAGGHYVLSLIFSPQALEQAMVFLNILLQLFS